VQLSAEIRSFIAIELPEEVRLGLRGIQARLKQSGHTFVKWVAPESIHLTLKFLGNIPAGQVTDIARAMEEASRGFLPFRLKIGKLGAFPNLRRPRVVWVGIDGEVDRLTALQQRLDAALARLGFARETRPFSPHLTLARLREGTSLRDCQDFAGLVTGAEAQAGTEISVDCICLMKSDLRPSGAVYTRLAEVTLND